MEKPEAGSIGPGPYRQPPPAAGPGFGQSWKRTALEVGIIAAMLVALILVLRGCAGCASTAIVSALPADIDAAIGKAGGEAMRAQYSVGSDKVTPEQRERVEKIFNELRENLTPEESAILINPRITVVADPQVNAFAMPGGEVFVLTGLLDRVKDDDDLVRGVLAHELGHAVHRHGVRGLVRNAIYGLALSFLLGDMDAVTGTVLAGASKLDRLSHSRSMEEESDDFGVTLLQRAKRDPEGLARFLESLESAPVPELLSTHPDSKDRAEAIRDRLKSGK
ncbi:MAG: M48 family metallopeptidase [Polyangiaceae bacterium]|nr:M48 family metallopeptidase [Polyangiaceae bacterium]NUQ75472.1 M48 family metallopeptidase [Polyangiaceae bacterium]